MTRADRVLLGAILTGCLCLALASVPGLAAPAESVVVAGPTGELTLDLSLDAEYTVDGHLGPVLIRVADGEARFVRSPCPSRRCVMSGPVDAKGGAVACLPGGVTISRTRSEDVDCVVR